MCQALVTAVEGALGPVVGLAGAGGTVWQRGHIASACFGLSGVDGPEDEKQITDWLRGQGVHGKLAVVNDGELILSAGTPEGWGVALISGAGSVCLARARDGRRARAGGWGPILGDVGSGYQIAVDALQYAMRAADGCVEAPGLLRAALHHWGASQPEQLINRVYSPDVTKQRIADFATAVVDLAGRGDTAAREVVDHAADGLAALVEAVIRKLRLEQPPLALGGATLRAGLRKQTLDKLAGRVGPVNSVPDGAQGAVAVARRLLAAG
jgi:N-acetylglucosamine kinase-like BadF-type ATPase